MYVYIGRFQPLHKGHVETLEEIIRKFGDNNGSSKSNVAVAVVGFYSSSTPILTPSNPLPPELVVSLWKEVLNKYSLKAEVVLIKTTFPYLTYFLQIRNTLSKIEELDKIKLLTCEKKEYLPLSLTGIKVILLRKDKREISSTTVRNLILSGRIKEALKFLPYEGEMLKKVIYYTRKNCYRQKGNYVKIGGTKLPFPYKIKEMIKSTFYSFTTKTL